MRMDNVITDTQAIVKSQGDDLFEVSYNHSEMEWKNEMSVL